MNTTNRQFLRQRVDPLQIKTITEKNAKRFEALLPNALRDVQPGSGYAALGAELYGIPCGALELKAGEGSFDISSLFVDVDKRRSGVGTRLLLAAKEFAAERDVGSIYAEFLLDEDEQRGVQTFFTSCGFYLAENGSSMYIFELADIAKSETIKKLSTAAPGAELVSMAALPRALETALRRQAGTDFIAELAPWNAKGQIIGELSRGIADNGQIRAFVIITQLNGRLYLNSAYAQKEFSRQFGALLAETLLLASEKYAALGQMCVTAINPASNQLVEKLAGALMDRVTKRTVRAMCWSLEQELAAFTGRERTDAGDTAAGMEILVPKLMRLMDFLENEDCVCDLMMAELPYVMVSRGETIMLMAYTPVDDRMTRFDLSLTARLPSGGDIRALNEENRFCTAFEAEGETLLRYTLPECGLPVTREQFLAVLESFSSELAMSFKGNPEDS